MRQIVGHEGSSQGCGAVVGHLDCVLDIAPCQHRPFRSDLGDIQVCWRWRNINGHRGLITAYRLIEGRRGDCRSINQVAREIQEHRPLNGDRNRRSNANFPQRSANGIAARPLSGRSRQQDEPAGQSIR